MAQPQRPFSEPPIQLSIKPNMKAATELWLQRPSDRPRQAPGMGGLRGLYRAQEAFETFRRLHLINACYSAPPDPSEVVQLVQGDSTGRTVGNMSAQEKGLQDNLEARGGVSICLFRAF